LQQRCFLAKQDESDHVFSSLSRMPALKILSGDATLPMAIGFP
jgi:hypothetical protein